MTLLPGMRGWKRPINVVSLFDGMSCGQIALERAGINVKNYYASEIDKHAIKVTQSNYPKTIQVGDVTRAGLHNLPYRPNLFLGGSPCQGFSYLGNQLALDHPKSILFFEYIRVMKLIEPEYFILENVRMAQRHQDVISEHLGCEPIAINSSLLSGASRPRLYWTNIPFRHISSANISLDAIIEWNDMSRNSASWHRWWAKNSQYQLSKNYSCVLNNEHKAICLTARMVASWNGNLVQNPMGFYRFISPIEAERLQTVPDNYTAAVSDTQRYKMLGNGWTVDIIAHVLSGMPL